MANTLVNSFKLVSGKKVFVRATPEEPRRLRAGAATVYYKTTDDVSSGSNDGSIAAGGSFDFVTSQWVTATANTRVDVYSLDYRQAGKPYNIFTWQAPTATSGTDTACTNGTAYVGSVYVPETCTVTGIQYLVGSVGGTTKVVASLHDSAGNVLANSATAGTTVGTLAQVQQVALTATYNLQGGQYVFIGLTFDGTTAKFRSIPAHCQHGIVGNGVTQTFGTVAAFTPPTTFTADKVPVASLY